MRPDQLRWMIRTIVLFLIGIVPSVLLILFLLLMSAFTAPLFSVFGSWFVAMIVLGLLGVIGLWGATFRDGEERVLPVKVTIGLLCCGLLAAGPILIEQLPMALDGNAFGGWWMVVLLVGPVACALYALFEVIVRGVLATRASNKRLQATRETRTPEA
jgi:hypothetical protein